MPRNTYLTDINFATFNPAVFEPKAADYQLKGNNILAHGLDQLQNRMNAAREEKTKFDETVGQLRDTLNIKDQQWFDDKIKDIDVNFNNLLNSGEFGEAYRYGMSEIGNLFKDREVHERAEANSQFDTWKKNITDRFNKGLINPIDYEYLLNSNEYDFTPGVGWKPKVEAVDSFDALAYFTNIASKLPEERNVYRGGTTSYTDSEITQSGGGSDYQRKRAEKIRALSDEYLKDPAVYAAAQQRMRANNMKYNQLQSQIDNLDITDPDYDRKKKALLDEQSVYAITDKDGQLITEAKAYHEKEFMRDSYPELLSYEWITTIQKDSTKPRGNSDTTMKAVTTFDQYGNAHTTYVHVKVTEQGSNLDGTGLDVVEEVPVTSDYATNQFGVMVPINRKSAPTL